MDLPQPRQQRQASKATRASARAWAGRHMARGLRSPVTAEGVAVARVAGVGPGGPADAGADEANAAVAQADGHAVGVGRLRAAGVAGDERDRLNLEDEAAGVAGPHGLVGGVMAHD